MMNIAWFHVFIEGGDLERENHPSHGLLSGHLRSLVKNNEVISTRNYLTHSIILLVEINIVVTTGMATFIFCNNPSNSNCAT